jgi:hypothetical protein
LADNLSKIHDELPGRIARMWNSVHAAFEVRVDSPRIIEESLVSC